MRRVVSYSFLMSVINVSNNTEITDIFNINRFFSLRHGLP
ncbi:hypothetical protein ACIN8IBEIGE_100155 [Acinetobacter sp. 8I-beige]|nr:hypothetical protein ACIN8IBEIGE_100155 [Acinetobacter sp. 8I-beige]